MFFTTDGEYKKGSGIVRADPYGKVSLMNLFVSLVRVGLAGKRLWMDKKALVAVWL